MWDPDNDFDEETGRKQFEYEQEKLTPRKRGSVMATPEIRQTKTWNGVSVKNMESSHVMNAILYCEKKFTEAQMNHLNCFGGTNPKEQFYFKSVYEMFPEYVNLRQEWDRRMESV